MRRPHGDPLLTTRQVAEMCGTTDDTIRHFADRGDLVGHLSGTAWEFPLSEAQRFCASRRGNRAPGWTAGPSGPPRPSPVRRAGGVGLEALNATASVVSLAMAVGLDSNRVIGFALAGLNLLLVALRKVWTAIRRRARERAIADGRADPDAIASRAGGGGLALLTGLQVICLAATVAFLAVTASPLEVQARVDGFLDEPPMLVLREVYEESLRVLSEFMDPPVAQTRPVTVRRTPTPVPTVVPTVLGTAPSTIQTIVAKPTRPVVIVPSPTVPPPPDRDGDGVPDRHDNCPDDPNLDQTDTDVDGPGDACDPVEPDRDGDRVPDDDDNCPNLPNLDQADGDHDETGDACEPIESDGDDVPDDFDNCRDVVNGDQADADGDGIGDACDKCPNTSNDVDGNGGLCDPGGSTFPDLDGDKGIEPGDPILAPPDDPDGDGIPNGSDNCDDVSNGDQADGDEDGIGTACDDMDGNVE